MKHTSRRAFLGGIGASAVSASLAFAYASQLGWASDLTRRERERLRFGANDELIDLLQATPADEVLPLVVQRLKTGTTLVELVGASALANARAYGGTNYNGYHTLMALCPSFEMAVQAPGPYSALPVLKVVHRNARFLQESGCAHEDALAPVEPAAGDVHLAESIRAREVSKSERELAALASRSLTDAYDQLVTVVRDDIDVHRIVLAWRAYDLLRMTGKDQTLTMFRQSLRFCIASDGNREKRGQAASEVRALLPRLMEEHRLNERERGTKALDDARIEALSVTLFSGERAAAAKAVAEALGEGFAPEEVGRALSLAAVRLLLHDPGRAKEEPGKPVGSVHGASVGVHASDAANAWRHIARIAPAPAAAANLIVGAYHTAGQSRNVGAEPFDRAHAPCEIAEPEKLLAEISGRIRERDQAAAMAAARRYTALRHSPEDLFELLLEFAISEDGALHAEKFFRTAQEEHGFARKSHRAEYLIALTRVMASHHGFPAPGVAEARKLLSA
ncbi:MAG TPA: hypothetical protein VM509_13085 [Planctomycetota bacterium]|nr:hypothetical protein [Planctomycetota bacterium]